MLQTGRTTETIVCGCGQGFEALVVRVLDLETHPELADSLLAERLNPVRCPACGQEFAAPTQVFVHDPKNGRYVGCYPEAVRERELELRVAFYQSLLELGISVPAHVRAARFAFGPRAWAEALGLSLPASPWPDSMAGPDLPELGDVVLPAMDADELDPTIAMLEPEAEPAPIAGGESSISGPVVQELEEDDFEEVDDLAQQGRRHAALMERWRESGQTHYAFLEGGALTLFQLHAEPEAFGERVDLFFQLQRTENFPLIALLLVSESGSGNQVLYWLFNLDNRIDVRFLRCLTERFEVRLHLFSGDYQPARELVFSQSLERNVAYVLEQAQAWLEKIEPKRRNFFIAASKFDAAAYRKLGKLPKGPPADAFRDLPTPGVTRLALDILVWWSQPDHYEYLIFIKSFPVERFQSILGAVLDRAIHFGLAMTEKMNRMALELGLVGDRSELVRRQLLGAAAVARGETSCDLDPAALAENWRSLFESASAQGLEVDAALMDLAREAEGQARDQGPAIPLDLDDEIETFAGLEQLEPFELRDLLTDPEHRVAAVRALAQRGDSRDLECALAAICRMGRSELEDLGDALAGYGPAAESELLRLLSAQRGSRAACALRALALLKGPDAGPLLIAELAAGRQGVWRVAEALLSAQPGVPMVMLLELSRHPEPAVRRRAARVLATRLEPEAMKRLERMALEDPNPRVRTTARRGQGLS